MGLQWQGAYFAFAVMMFGVASAPRAYGKFADLVVDIIKRAFPDAFPEHMLDRLRCLFDHYVADFFGGDQSRARAFAQFEAVLFIWDALGIPWKTSKVFAPAMRQKIIGYLWDTHHRTVSVPEEKLNPYSHRKHSSDASRLRRTVFDATSIALIWTQTLAAISNIGEKCFEELVVPRHWPSFCAIQQWPARSASLMQAERVAWEATPNQAAFSPCNGTMGTSNKSSRRH
jgi:hypothetical protein